MRDEARADRGVVASGDVTSVARGVILARDGTALAVHPLTSALIPALQRFDAGLSAHTRSVFLPHAYDDATLARCVARCERGQDRAYVLCSGAKVVGYFFLWEFDHPAPILGIGLTDAWQGKGLGGSMLKLLIEDARAAGRDAIELTTVLTNEHAHHLYRRAGFEDAGETDNIAGDGRVVRERRMFLPLKPGVRPRERAFKPPDA